MRGVCLANGCTPARSLSVLGPPARECLKGVFWLRQPLAMRAISGWPSTLYGDRPTGQKVERKYLTFQAFLTTLSVWL
jgi:hypothetical protein